MRQKLGDTSENSASRTGLGCQFSCSTLIFPWLPSQFVLVHGQTRGTSWFGKARGGNIEQSVIWVPNVNSVLPIFWNMWCTLTRSEGVGGKNLEKRDILYSSCRLADGDINVMSCAAMSCATTVQFWGNKPCYSTC